MAHIEQLDAEVQHSVGLAGCPAGLECLDRPLLSYLKLTLSKGPGGLTHQPLVFEEGLWHGGSQRSHRRKVGLNLRAIPGLQTEAQASDGRSEAQRWVVQALRQLQEPRRSAVRAPAACQGPRLQK